MDLTNDPFLSGLHRPECRKHKVLVSSSNYVTIDTSIPKQKSDDFVIQENSQNPPTD
jgi:hypothetical protein